MPSIPRQRPIFPPGTRLPLDEVLRPAGYLHLQLTSPRRAADKLKYLAGSEAAMGALINGTTPELVAERLRSVAVPLPSTTVTAVAATTEGASA